MQLSHPESADLAFLYGTILTDGRDDSSHTETANLCVFADRQVDRSPTGSGVTARMAVQYHKGFVGQGTCVHYMCICVGILGIDLGFWVFFWVCVCVCVCVLSRNHHTK